MSGTPPSTTPLAVGPSASRGIALMVLGGAVLTTQDALMKWLIADYSVGELLFYRGAFALLPVAAIIARRGGFQVLKTRNVRGHAIRNLFVLANNVLFILALAFMPLTDVITISFTGPLFVTALAVPFLGERVGWRRWTAVVVGFSGIFIMMRPGEAALQLAALLPVGAALGAAARDIVTRRMAASENTFTILFYLTLTITLAGLATLPFGWQRPTAADLAMFAATGLLFAFGQYAILYAFRLAEATVLVPFRYVNLVWATLFGFLVWGDLPDRFMIAGATLVVGSGLYVLHRETALFRRRHGDDDR